jgi:hypothetical protein
MALLRLASNETKKIQLGDSEEDFIEVKADISKRTFIQLIQSMPEGITDGTSLTISDSVGLQEKLFSTFVTDWSLKDEKGAPLPADVDNYLLLSREAADAVDAAVVAHFESLSPSKDDATKSA